MKIKKYVFLFCLFVSVYAHVIVSHLRFLFQSKRDFEASFLLQEIRDEGDF